jgi:hypothetical protein
VQLTFSQAAAIVGDWLEQPVTHIVQPTDAISAAFPT